MNKIFRIVFNTTTGRWVVASEMAKGRKKASSSGKVGGAVAATLVTALAASGMASAGSVDGGTAIGLNSVSVGPSSTAGTGGTAVGASAQSTAGDATAVGQNTVASGVNSTVVGNQVEAKADGSIAIQGDSVQTVAIDAASTNAIAIGTSSTVTNAVSGIALGNAAASSASKAIAVGDTARASGANSVALGASSTAYTVGDIAIGGGASASRVGISNQGNSIAIGSNTNGAGKNSIAIGTGAATNTGALYSGTDSAMAIGTAAYAEGWNAIAIGDNAKTGVAGNNVFSVALGSSASALPDHATALGATASVTAYQGTALGFGANASTTNSVALGAGSTTTADLTVAAYNPGNTALSGIASAANGEVSIGKAGGERRLTNLAAGSAATDAVNVSQLKSLNDESDFLGLATAARLGGGASFNTTTGGMTAPSYALTNANAIGGSTGAATDVGTGFTKVDNALGNLGGRMTTSEGDITNLKSASRYFKATGLNDGTDDAVASSGVAIGAGATTGIGNSIYNPTTYQTNVALGTGAAAGAAGAISIGDHAKTENTNIAIGAGADATSGARQSMAVGLVAKATGWDSTAVGFQAIAGGNAAIALGDNAVTSADKSVALGSSANATAVNSVALGAGSTTTANLAAAAYNPGSATLSGTASAANGEVSIGKSGGERRLTNLAAGSAATDAVNVSQLQAQDATVDQLGANTAAMLGGGAAYSATTGAITAPSYALTNANAIGGSTGAATDVGAGFTKVDNALGNLGGRMTTVEGNVTNLQNTVNTINNGGGTKYFHSKSTLADSTATGNNSVAVGGAANAVGISAIAIGSSASADADWTFAAGNAAAAKASGDVALGASAQADGAGQYATALGVNAQATATQSTAVGAGAKATHHYSVALGQNSTTDRTNSVSVGNASYQRQITSLAKGTADTDAVNVSQLKGVTTALGGSAGVNADGTIKAPSYTVQGQAGIADVGTALGKLDTATTTNANNITNVTGRVTTVEGNVSNLQTTVNNISSGTVGLVKQDATTRAITVAKDSDGALVNFAGTAGARKLTGVFAGDLSATSVDAVNGSQLFATNQNVTTNTTNIAALGSRVTTTEGDITNLKSANRYFKASGLNDGTDDAVASSGVAIGAGATTGIGTSVYNPTTYQTNVALGTGATAGAAGAISIGDHAKTENTNIAIGAGADATSGARQSIAVGLVAKATGWDSTAMGFQAIAGGNSAIALGGNAVTSADKSVALGSSANATAVNSVALGAGSTTTANLAAAAYNPGSATLSGTASAANGEVSIGKSGGERRLTNLAAGSAATDAVNVSQLQAQDATVDQLGANTAAMLGGGAAYSATTGAITAPSYALTNANAIGGSTGAATDVGAGFTKVDNALGNLGGRMTTAEGKVTNVQNIVNTITNGGGVKYFHTNTTLADSTTTGADSIAIGGNAASDGKWSLAVGTSSKATADNSVALGNSSLADRANSVSVGKAGSERLVANVAKGTADTDAVNVSQLKGVTTALGGSAGVNADGTIKAPSYTVQGQAGIADVGTALDKLDTATTSNATNITNVAGRVTTVEGNVSNLQTTVNNISSGSVGLVKQDATTRTISVAKDTDGALVDFTGTAGARKLTGVSAGTLSAASTDAVNGSQLFATNQNVTKNTTDITALGGRVTTTEGDISNIKTDVTNIGGRVTTVEGNVSSLQTTVNNISSGTVGLVKQDATTRTISVAKDTDGALVDLTGTAGARKLTGVSAGDLSATSVDAVNGSQLNTTNQNVTALGGRVTTAEGNISTIKTDVTNIGGRVTTVEGSVSNLQTTVNNISSGSVGLVQQDATTRTITVAKDSDGALVNFAGTAGARKLTGVSAGDLSATSVDAVNGSQLNTTNQNVTALGSRVTTAEGDISNIKTDVAKSQGDISTIKTDVAKSQGDITSIKTDMTNIGGRVTTVEGNVSTLDSRVTKNEGDITNLYGQISSGSVGLVQQDATTRSITVAKDSDGVLVNFAGTAGARKLTGVSAGDLSAGSVDAVNGSQLYTTNQTVAKNTTDISALDGRVTTNEGDIADIKTDVTSIDGRVTTAEGDITNIKTDVTNIDGRVTRNEGDISTIKTDVTNIGGRVTTVEGNVSNLYTQLNSGSIGLVQQAAAGGKLTVGAGVDGSEVDFANNAGRARRLTRVAAGTGAEDAVNVSQLKTVTDGLGGGASIDPVTGLVTGPTYLVTNSDGSQSSVHTVGDAVTNLDGRVYNNTTQITNLTRQISSGTVGMVQQAGAGQKLTVGKDTDGSEVSFANAAGEARKLSGVAAGAVSATSTDAVNGSQLHGVSQSVATALGGGSAVNADGTVSAPSYSVTNADGTTSKVAGVEGAISNIDGRVYNNTVRIDNVESSVSNLSSKIDSGAVGLVQQAAPGEQLTVGKATDGASVNFAGTAGDRTLTGIAAGKADNDAVNIGQLKAVGLIGEKGEAKSVLGYDGADKGSVTLGGEGAAKPVTIHNVAAGVSDTDAVNVSQLNARLQAQSNSVMAQANAYADDRFKSAMNEIDSLRTDVDDRFQVQDERIDRLGAMSTAMASMTASMSGVNRINRVGVGAGESNGRLAMAVGYQRAFRNSGATLTAGASFTDEDSTVGVGAGFGW